jgi:uncharacterized protein (TIGR03086 family)
VTAALASAVELLDRALAYTRVVLSGVDGADLHRRTPCRGWDLGQLLGHMDDALDTFTEASRGVVEIPARGWSPRRVDRLREKACTLLGAWAGQPPSGVRVGDAALSSELLLATAALEITVHGWDVSWATTGPAPIPEELADRLLVVAHRVVDAADRGVRFAPPVVPAAGASSGERLLAFLGRT